MTYYMASGNLEGIKVAKFSTLDYYSGPKIIPSVF